jgi:hypothetical protein
MLRVSRCREPKYRSARQSILTREIIGGEIIAALEIDRIDFLYRDEFSHVDAAVGFGFQRFQLRVFDADVLVSKANATNTEASTRKAKNKKMDQPEVQRAKRNERCTPKA